MIGKTNAVVTVEKTIIEWGQAELYATEVYRDISGVSSLDNWYVRLSIAAVAGNYVYIPLDYVNYDGYGLEVIFGTSTIRTRCTGSGGGQYSIIVSSNNNDLSDYFNSISVVQR